MLYTSAEANKLLKQVTEELNQLTSLENQSRDFVAATNEDIESVRPEYDYLETAYQINVLNEKIRKIKHAINSFNTTTVIPDFNMTIDEMLIYLPQLNQKKTKLTSMANKLPKVRERNFGQTNIIDYHYTNYDIDLVKKDLEQVIVELNKAQVALDLVNTTVKFEIVC